MPSRILRDGILSSERIAKLGWPEEVFYRRLMSVVDDYGRYYATPMLLRAACYPLQLNKVSDPDIEKWITVCVTAALVRVYLASDGKRYLELLDFKQRVRASVSKFPPMSCTCKTDDGHMTVKCQSCARLDVVVVVDDTAPAKPNSLEKPESVSQGVWDDFVQMRKAKKAVVTDTAIKQISKEAERASISLENALQECCARGWTGFKAEWHTKAQQGQAAEQVDF